MFFSLCLSVSLSVRATISTKDVKVISASPPTQKPKPTLASRVNLECTKIHAGRSCRLALNPAATSKQRSAEIQTVVRLHGKLLTVRLLRTHSFTSIKPRNFTASFQGNPCQCSRYRDRAIGCEVQGSISRTSKELSLMKIIRNGTR